MFCKKCGSEIPEGSNVCSNCGTAVSAKPAEQQTAYQQPVYQQPVYQQPVYQQPVYGQPRNPNDGKGLSITALVLGICGVVLSWISVINVIVLAAGIFGIIFGYKGRQKSIAAYGKASGLATAGFVLGIIGTSICGVGVLSCTVCVAAVSGCSSCGSAALSGFAY